MCFALVPVSSGPKHGFGDQVAPHAGTDIDKNPVVFGSVESSKAYNLAQASSERVFGMID